MGNGRYANMAKGDTMIDIQQIELAQAHINKQEYSQAYNRLVLAIGYDDQRPPVALIMLYAETLAQIEPHLQDVISPQDLRQFQMVIDYTIGRDALTGDE